MGNALRTLVLRLLKVPEEPQIPGGGRAVRVFRAAPNYFRYRLVAWGMGQMGALAGIVAGTIAIVAAMRDVADPTLRLALQLIEAAAWTVYLGQLLFSLAVLRLDFEMRWYILSDRALRIREGIVSVREKTLTFANIQQVSIRQGPLQRLLGIADVQVSTAGGGSGGGGGHDGQTGESMHEAYFRGVDNAEEIRTAIRERVRLHRDAGLGDPDEPGHALAPVPLPVHAGPAPAPDVLEAARELRDEVRALRRTLAPS